MPTLRKERKLTGAALESEKVRRRGMLGHAREFVPRYFEVQLSDVMALSENEVTELRDLVDRLEYTPAHAATMPTHSQRLEAQSFAEAVGRAAAKTDKRIRDQVQRQAAAIAEFVAVRGIKPTAPQRRRLASEPASAVAFEGGESVRVLAWSALTEKEHKRLRTLVAKAASKPADYFDELDAQQQIRAMAARVEDEQSRPDGMRALAPAGSVVIPKEAFESLWAVDVAVLATIAWVFADPSQKDPFSRFEDDGRTLTFPDNPIPSGFDVGARISPQRYQSLQRLHEDGWVIFKRGVPNRVSLGPLYLAAARGEPVKVPARKDPTAW